MTNFKLFGFDETQARDLKNKIRKIVKKGGFDPSDMVITYVVGSTVERLEDETKDNKAPYIEIADDNSERAMTILEELSGILKEDMEVTTINIFVPAEENFVAPKKR